MADQENPEIPRCQISVKVLKNQSLGNGSYGAVYKAKYGDLLCAAKIIHATLVTDDPTALHQNSPQREHRLPIRRFEQECKLMNAVRHPNIVQYLGMSRDTDTRLPVLVMELMDDNLTHFLESFTQPIPYNIQVNICHDITLALSFLHSKNIVHRDLSSGNILLRGNIIAKVTDFGMARLGDINPRATCTNIMCPGAEVYMPPEAVQDKAVYTEKIDCFSFGVIIVQILTRQYPKPEERFKKLDSKMDRFQIRIPEKERRQNHISLVDQSHPLLPIALNCLKDKDSERPSACQLCERVADLKSNSESDRLSAQNKLSLEGAGVMEEKDHTISLSKEEEIQQLRQQLQERDEAKRQMEERERQLGQVSQQLTQQLQQLQLQINHVLREKSRQLQEKERQLGRVNQQLEASEQVVAQFERQIAELEQPLSQREQQKIKASSRGKELTSFKLTWRKEASAPHKMSRVQCNAVVDNSTIYFIKNRATVVIYSYDVTTNGWSKLRECVDDNNIVRTYSSLVIINGMPTIVGGRLSSGVYLDTLLSLVGQKWNSQFRSMPTKRECTIALCTRNALIVAGGMGEDGRVLSTVEVMNTETHEWSTAADLPQPISRASATVCGDQLYILGGDNKDHHFTKSVYTCSVNELLQSCVSTSNSRRSPFNLAKFKKTEHAAVPDNIWRQIADLPVIGSTCVSFHGRLLAVGGLQSGIPVAAIYMYDSTNNSWKVISHMTTGRYQCFTAVLPDNQLMVVGGYIRDSHCHSDIVQCHESDSDTVEIASM